MAKLKKKGILLNLSQKRSDSISKIAKEKEKTVTAIIEDAIDVYLKMQLDNNPIKSSSIFEGDYDFDIDKETKIW